MVIGELTNATDTPPAAGLAPPLAALLSQARQRIRGYLWAEGLAAIALFLLAAFWVTLVFDWFFEPPAGIRVALLLAAAAGAAWIGYRLLVDRLRVRLTARNLAVLLERKYPQFSDSLLTAVEYSESTSPTTDYERQMVESATFQAIGQIDSVDFDEMFNPRPLLRNVLAATLLGAGLFTFALADRGAVETWVRRVIFLSDDLWPRMTRLTIEGFENGSIKVARGSDVELIVKADTSMRVPQTVRVQYRTGEGVHGRAAMTQRGKAVAGQEAFQQFSHDFKGILSPLTFDVSGGDDRHRNLRIEVVESPAVTAMTLLCEYPEYMHRDPREIAVSGAMQIPYGAKVRLQFATNKDMTLLDISDAGGAATSDPTEQSVKTTTIKPERSSDREFAYDLGALASDRTLLISLLDADQIRNREPNRLSLTIVPDETPQLDVRLRGVGPAITPSAQIPVAGEVKDDHGVARTWFEFVVDGQSPAQRELAKAPRENTELKIEEAYDVRERDLKPGQKVQLTLKARDTYSLESGPQTGSSSPFLFDVVTPEDLRSLLEARELNLRRRFEQLIGEVTESRDLLSRLGPAKPTANPATDATATTTAQTPPADPAADKDSTAADGDADDAEAGDKSSAEKGLSADRLSVEQLLQNSRKNADETRGVAVAFDDIHDELVNNRVDTPELKSRLKQGIAEPLRQVAEAGFVDLEARLTSLQKALGDAPQRATELAATQRQFDKILFEMQQVLGKMVELETFNEVVDLLREIIDSQEEVNTKTKDLRKTKLKDLLE